MHVFSLALEVVDLAQREAERNQAETILEISIEVGDLSGVESDAFESALELVVKDSVLHKSIIVITRVAGKGKCIACDLEFEMHQRLDTCPQCRSFPSIISGGEEFRVVSIVVE